MIQWEEVTLEEATHVEINGAVHEMNAGGVRLIKSGNLCIEDKYIFISILIGMDGWMQIPQEAFSLLGIRCLRKFNPKPIEFEAEFASYDGNWRPLYSLDDGFAHQNFKKKKFKCIEILEDEE